MSPPALSIVVPVAPREAAWPALLERLRPLLAPARAEVILSATAESPRELPAGARWLAGETGRARQLNAGAAAARGQWLWFLHADSQPDAQCLNSAVAGGEDQQLGWFRLRFAADGPLSCAGNAWGANLRSRWLGLPFGDQGLLLARHDFDCLSGFDESLSRGEDLDFAVRAAAAGMPPRRLPGTITTSARRYREHGWLTTTLANLRDTARMRSAALRRGRGQRAANA